MLQHLIKKCSFERIQSPSRWYTNVYDIDKTPASSDISNQYFNLTSNLPPLLGYWCIVFIYFRYKYNKKKNKKKYNTVGIVPKSNSRQTQIL